AEEELAALLALADAAALFECSSSAPGPVDSSDPTNLTTRFSLQIAQALKGTPPTTITTQGRKSGSLEVVAVHAPRLVVGQRYLGFFRTGSVLPQEPELVFAARITGDELIVRDQRPSLSAFLATVPTASVGGAQ